MAKKNAKELFKQIKKGEVSAVELKDIVKDVDCTFIKDFAEVIKNETITNAESYKTVISFFNRQIELLNEIVKDGNVTADEKEQVLKIISDINDKVHSLEKNRTDNSYKFKKFVTTCATVIITVGIYVLTGGKVKK